MAAYNRPEIGRTARRMYRVRTNPHAPSRTDHRMAPHPHTFKYSTPASFTPHDRGPASSGVRDMNIRALKDRRRFCRRNSGVRRGRRGVSDVVGTILMLALTV